MKAKKVIAYGCCSLLLAVVLGFFLLPRYLQRVILYGNPGIEDQHIFENRRIQAGSPQPWPLAAHYNQGRINVAQMHYFDSLETVAFLVVQDSAIIYENYWQHYHNQTISNSFSVAKSIVALLAGIARDEGYIQSFEQKVAEFYPPFAADARANIRIKDVLNMSAGLDWDESYSSPFSPTAKAYYGNNLEGLVQAMQAVEAPGQRYRYQSGLTQLLAFVVANAVGQDISSYASEKLWLPLGAEQDALWSLDKKDGVEKAYCCFYASARDFARIGQLVLQQGLWKGVPLVSQAFLEEATHPVPGVKNGDSEREADFYGYQWWRLTYKGMEVKYARGIGGQYIFVIPHKNMVIVRLGHKRSTTRDAQGIPMDIGVWLDTAFDITLQAR